MDWIFSTRIIVFEKMSVEDNISSVLELTNLSKEQIKNGTLLEEFDYLKFVKEEATCCLEVSEEE